MIVRVSNQAELDGSSPCAITAFAEARFRANSHTALRGISCNVDQGRLLLEERLETFYQKQLAQEIVAKIEGVEQVVNQIEVVSRAI